MLHTRRSFLRQAGLFSACTVLGAPCVARAQVGQVAPSNRVTIGLIGFGRQAKHSNLKPFLTSPDAQVVAVCDVDAWRLAEGCSDVNEYYASKTPAGSWKGCSAYRDYRELLMREDIDAVMISTPDHWHAQMSIDAARAGKDVCCEKPVTLTIDEGRRVCDTMQQCGRVFRTDTEVRSVRNFQRACELVLNGKIGRLRRILSGVPRERVPDEPVEPATRPPDGLDYELWLGPAPLAPYSEQRVHPAGTLDERPGWMQVRDYCDGMICNWGTHLNDIVQWGNGTEFTGPVEVEARGRYADHGLYNVLVDFKAHYRYANGVSLSYTMDRPFVRFEGDEGWIQADYSIITAANPLILREKPKPDEVHLPLLSEKKDFIECVKTRRRPQIDAEVGHRTNSLCHLAHISIQLGGARLQWDPVRELFVGNDAANRLKYRQALRPPWLL